MAGTVRVNNKSARLHHLRGKKGTFILKPGENEVPAELWGEVLQNKSRNAKGEWFNIHEQLREDGELDWEGDYDEPPAPSKPINELNEREAVRVVKETFDPALLDQYSKQDSRPKVQKAITDQQRSAEDAIAKGKAEGKGMSDVMDKEA